MVFQPIPCTKSLQIFCEPSLKGNKYYFNNLLTLLAALVEIFYLPKNWIVKFKMHLKHPSVLFNNIFINSMLLSCVLDSFIWFFLKKIALKLPQTHSLVQGPVLNLLQVP